MATLQSYTTKQWAAGNPITADAMQNIESGIKNLNDWALGHQQEYSVLNGKVDTASTNAANALNTANSADLAADAALRRVQAGENAWNAIDALLEHDGNGDPTNTLASRIEADEEQIGKNASGVSDVKSWITSAFQGGNQVVDNTGTHTAKSLLEKVLDIERRILDVSTTANNSASILNPTGDRSVLERLSDIDANTTPELTLPTVITEIKNARGTNADGGNNLNLSQRFEQDETRISTNETDITNRIKYDDIVNDFNGGIRVPLSAEKGKELNARIGGVYTSEFTVADGVQAAQNNAETYADTNKVDKNDIYNGLDHEANDQNVLDARQGKVLKDTIDSLQTSLEERIELLDGNTGAVSNINSRIDTLEEDLDGRLDTIDETLETLNEDVSAAATKTTVNGIDGRLQTVESTVNEISSIYATKTELNNNSTTFVLNEDDVNFDSSYTPINIKNEEIINNNDYIIQSPKDHKYYYWKYIDNEWHLMGGASTGEGGGTGNSSGMFASSLNDITDPNKDYDYFVGNNNIGYTHYRYIEDEGFRRILPKNIVGGNTRINAVYDGEELKSQTLEIYDIDGTLIADYPIVGGSGGQAYSIRFLPIGSTTLTVPSDDSYKTIISAQPLVKQGNELLSGVSFTGKIMYKLSTATSDNWTTSTIVLPLITNGSTFNVDVSSILAANLTTVVRLEITINTGDADTYSRYIDYTITRTQISISSTFDPSIIITNKNLVFPYKCIGVGLEKTVHFKVDGVDIIEPVITNRHNYTESVSIPLSSLEYGAHKLQVYFIANEVYSNILNYYFIYNQDNTRITPIVAMAAATDDIVYGEELTVNYTVYTPNQEKTDTVEIILYTIEDDVRSEYSHDTLVNVRREASTWKTVNYPEPASNSNVKIYIEIIATHKIDEEIYTDRQIIQVQINAFTNPNNYDFTEVAPRNVLYYYNAYGKTNNDADRESYEVTYIANDPNATELTFHGQFHDFNWATDGYQDGESLTIGGGATHTIDVPIFSQSYNGITIEPSSAQDIITFGRTIEIDYEVRSATDLNATIIECIDPNTHIGFRITPNCCYLLNSNTDVELDESGFILNESAIAAAYLQTNTRIHLVFVIEPRSTTLAFDRKYHQSVNIYINGEFANSCPYECDNEGHVIDSFTTDATISMGSDTCLLKLYSVKLYNRGLTHDQVLQEYKLAPNVLYDRLTRFADNDVLDEAGYVSYEKARKHYNCLLLVGPDPKEQATLDWPTISPFKGSKSPASRKAKETDTDYVGKTESGLIFTKPSSDPTTEGYVTEFSLLDKIPNGAPSYFGAAGSYCSSNNVQGTSSQKYPIRNLKVYLAKWEGEKTTTKNVALEPNEEVPEDTETVEIDGVTYKVVTETTPAQIKKVKYCLKGKDSDGNNLGTEESTFCWKADYMSTDHANTYNANIADGLFADKLSSDWDSKHYQNTVYGIRCLLFQKQGDNAQPVFVADGCLNNDKGNTKTFGLEDKDDDGADTLRQKWEFTNNTSPLDVFKSDNLFGINPTDSKLRSFAAGAFESSYPDEGDLKDEGLTPNYNHLQTLITWINKRACYLDYNVYDDINKVNINYTVSDNPGTGDTYNGKLYSTERELKKAIFKNEFTRHFNLNHVLTYYIFSEYIALCDNRAKNMFLRSEDIRSEVLVNNNNQIILNGNEYPDDDPEGSRWNQFVNTTTGVTDVSKIDWINSNFAVWAPVLYDLDSCFGAENVGLLTINYNADWQYKYNDKEAFSGFDSIFWLMVEDTYEAEIRELATSLYNNSLNFTTFYRQQIVGNKEATCPALTNQDMILKYEIPWNEGFINYAESPDEQTGEYPRQTPLYKYIERGTRFTQKATFMRQRSMLLSSKYVSNEFINSMISFRAGVLVTGENTLLNITANQDLYPAIMFSDNNTLVRPVSYIDKDGNTIQITNDYVPANLACQISTSQIGNSDTVKIVGASVLTDIGDISKYQPYELKVGSGTNLKHLIIGSDADGYINTSTEGIEGLSSCVLLEEINIQNCKRLPSLNLTSNGLIKKVYAGGSNVTNISLPNGGILDTIEYSENTTVIKLVNQSRLTNFITTYVGANDYNNVNTLWVENTPNVPIIDIVIKALSHLTGGIRLVGLDLDLGEDTTFLDNIANDLVKGKYLDSVGTKSTDKNKPPHITGRIKINKIRTSLYNKLSEMYPELIIYSRIDSNDEYHVDTQTEYAITYKDYDGSIFYVDYRIQDETFIDPVYDEDPITHEPYKQIPTRPDDEEHTYKFGTYNSQNKYIRFSGWIYSNTNTNPTSDDKVGGTVTFIAIYPTITTKQYTLSWYAEPNEQAIASIQAYYGTDMSSFESPEERGILVRAKSNTTNAGTYKVFKGWDKSIGKLTGDLNVYAQWEYSQINENTQSFDLSTATAADIYALSQISADKRTQLLESQLGTVPITIQLGHDFNYVNDNLHTYDLLDGAEKLTFTGEMNGVKVFDGTNGTNVIRPLDVNKEFVLALDYKFLLDKTLYDSSREFVLASCYNEDSSTNTIQGFKLSLNKSSSTSNPQQSITITWGTTSTTIDFADILDTTATESRNYCYSYRNMIVLQHKNTTEEKTHLYVYYLNRNTTVDTNTNLTNIYGIDGESQSTITKIDLNWNNNQSITTPLILGGNYASDGTIENQRITRRPAKGIIYWAKYWDQDIGENSCRALAAWPHEAVQFYLCGYHNGQTGRDNRQILDNTQLSFIAAQGIGDRYINSQQIGAVASGTNSYGWSTSGLRSYYNNRIYNSFPTQYQSIIKQTSVTANRANKNSDYDNTISLDYLYAPAEREVSTAAISSNTKLDEAQGMWGWLNVSNITNVYKPNAQSTTRLERATVTSVDTLRSRFLGFAIPPTAKIFLTTNNPANTTWTLNNEQVTIQSGDVWMRSDSDATTMYIYLNNNQINEGNYVDILNTNGGWRQAAWWELRTYTEENSTIAWNRFMKINTSGAIADPVNYNTNQLGRLRIICPEFSI